jgi:hypothetical protein
MLNYISMVKPYFGVTDNIFASFPDEGMENMKIPEIKL